MIIGVDATSRWIQCATVSEKERRVVEWQGPIEPLPSRLHSLIGETLTGGLIILGPGSYTGIRLSLTAMKMLTLVHEVPLMGLPLFDAYLTLNHALIQGVVLITSPSRKGVFNSQLFQTTADGFCPMTSLLQIENDQMNQWLSRFQLPMHWVHFGEVEFNIKSMPVTCNPKRLDIGALLDYYEHKIPAMTTASSLAPIYAYPSVVSK